MFEFEFGDELLIDSYRIPWLIWIQLLAMFLLVILLFYYTAAPSDLSLHFSTATATAAASQSVTGLPYVNRSFLTSSVANASHSSKVREHEIKESGPSTSQVAQRAKRPPDVRQREGSTTMDEGDTMIYEHSHHPCNFFGLAKQAFLKCLGLDLGPENSNRRRRHEKDD